MARSYNAICFTGAVTLVMLLTSGIAQAAKPPIPVGYATTRITGPLTKDGLVDYVAAFNEQLGKGVTPLNNAAVPLLILYRPKSFNDGYYKIIAGKSVYISDHYCPVNNMGNAESKPVG